MSHPIQILEDMLKAVVDHGKLVQQEYERAHQRINESRQYGGDASAATIERIKGITNPHKLVGTYHAVREHGMGDAAKFCKERMQELHGRGIDSLPAPSKKVRAQVGRARKTEPKAPQPQKGQSREDYHRTVFHHFRKLGRSHAQAHAIAYSMKERAAEAGHKFEKAQHPYSEDPRVSERVRTDPEQRVSSGGDAFKAALKKHHELEGSTLVHGVVAHPGTGEKRLHAWVEHRGKVHHLHGTVDRDTFYRAMKPSHVVRYEGGRAAELARSQGHHGPWDTNLRHMAGRYAMGDFSKSLDRPDMIGPRPLQPATQDRSLLNVREEFSRSLPREGAVPFVREGTQNGAVPSARPAPEPQPALVISKSMCKAVPEPKPDIPDPHKPGPHRLSPEGLQHQLKHGTYSLISAGPNSDDPAEKDMHEDHPMFLERHKKLRADLDKHGYAYTEVRGKWSGKGERSFKVYHKPEATTEQGNGVMVHHKAPSEFSHMRELAKKYNQNSVIHSHRGDHEMHYTTGALTGQHRKGMGHEMKPKADDDYTEVPHPINEKAGVSRRASRFALNFDWDKTHGHDQAVLKAIMDRMLAKAQIIRVPPTTANPSLQPEKERGVSYATQVVARDDARKSLRWVTPICGPVAGRRVLVIGL
jgi:hypothetical protein